MITGLPSPSGYKKEYLLLRNYNRVNNTCQSKAQLLVVILHKNTEYSVFRFYTENHYLGVFVILLLFNVGIRWGKAYNDIRKNLREDEDPVCIPEEGCSLMNIIKK